MRLSIIIPIYNVSKYIEQCLDSVVSQDFPDMECILVDDCGTDDSVAMVSSFIENHQNCGVEFVFLHHEHNRGLSAARNTGVEVARGDYVMYLDSDDCLTDHALQRLYAMVEKYGDVDLVQGCYLRDNQEKQEFHIFTKEYYQGDEAKDMYLEHEMCLMAWNKLVKRSIAQECRFIEGIINEDNPWNFLIFKRIESLCFCNEITYIYRVNPSGIMGSSDYAQKSRRSFMVVYDAIIKEMETMEFNRAFPVHKILNRYVFGFVLMKGAGKETFKATQYRLYSLYRRSRKYLAWYDRYIAFALRLPYPLIIAYAASLKYFMKLPAVIIGHHWFASHSGQYFMRRNNAADMRFLLILMIVLRHYL